MSLCLRISSPLSFHDTSVMLWRCFIRRVARDFHVFGTVSITMHSILSHSFTDSFTVTDVDGSFGKLVLGMSKYLLILFEHSSSVTSSALVLYRISPSKFETIFFSLNESNCIGSIKIIFFACSTLSRFGITSKDIEADVCRGSLN